MIIKELFVVCGVQQEVRIRKVMRFIRETLCRKFSNAGNSLEPYKLQRKDEICLNVNVVKTEKSI